ncbi:unnamed protein product [Leptidea sinapis]|uniref:Uncharacterized protein n=1 Tax=Leptidea sinapis TaxID=189913 RepID=A0A5E4R1C2_9NEOP|nr:unnamed protein product [Leptidea sinapis]
MNINLLKFVFMYLLITCALNISCIKPDDIRNYLGTRTPYRFKHNKNDTRLNFLSCKERKIWMLVRHGSRLPSAKDIVGAQTYLKDLKYEILMQHRNGRGELNEEQLRRLGGWTCDMQVENQKYLTLEGQDEMILLAERMQKRLPKIIKHEYQNQTFQFRYTPTQRTQQSARYFALGLFDKKIAQDVVFEPAVKVDTTLRFYKHCDRWQKQVKKNPETYKEQMLYGNSREMNDTLEIVSRKLGFDRVLSLDIVALMYRICGFETSQHKHSTSPWCYGFDERSIRRLEYYYDLKHYWLDGYGHELTYRPACMLMKHLVDNMRTQRRNATFLFAHSGTLLKLLTHLQLYKPNSHLRGHSIDEDRTFRVSDIDCFASNIAFILYKCKDGDKLLTLHQEKVVRLPMCDEELCPLDHLIDYYKHTIDNCIYEDICKL